MDSDLPPEDPAQQVAHAVLAARSRSDQEGRKRKTKDREDRGERLPR
jgi:hypothetical protein